MPRITIIILLYILTTLGLSLYVSPYYFIMFSAILIIAFVEIFLHTEDSDISIIRKILDTFRMKRVKTEYGRFFIIIKGQSQPIAYLYQDKFLYLDSIQYKYFTDVSNMKEWIKKEYDHIYKEKQARDAIKKQIKDWNGYIDLQTEREDKLNNLGVK